MAKNIKSKAPSTKAAKPAQIARIVLGVLLALNLGAAWMVLYPPGGSAESLEEDIVRLQAQVAQSRARLEETKRHVSAVEKGRGAADEFLNKYFIGQRSAPSTLLIELDQIAKRAGIKDRGNTFSAELIEGSDRLGMMTISANFEGTYRNLLNFVREIDRSNSFLIVESLSAAPQQGSNNLMVSIRLEAFFQQDGSMPEQVAQVEATQ